MYTMKDFIGRKIAVTFKNREERLKFLKMCEEKGIRWNSGNLATKFDPGDGTAVIFSLNGRDTITYGHPLRKDRKVIPFSEFECEETIGVIKRNGSTITVHMGDLHGMARCSPDDQFDLYTGCELALRRALGAEKKEPEKPKYYNGKMVCVENGGYSWWTVGKIYEYKDGIVTADDGCKYPKPGLEPYRDAENAKHPGCLDGKRRHNPHVTMLEIKE